MFLTAPPPVFSIMLKTGGGAVKNKTRLNTLLQQIKSAIKQAAQMACDPAMENMDSYTMPQSKSGIKPLNKNYMAKGGRIMRWRQMRQEKALAEQV